LKESNPVLGLFQIKEMDKFSVLSVVRILTIPGGEREIAV